jgi:transcriptional regulator with XRE-family HTH domain
MSAFGQRIKLLREAIGLSQARLADELGISRPAVSQIENGERKVCAEELQKIANIFNISIDELMNPDRQPQIMIKEKQAPYRKTTGLRINVPQKNLVKFREVLLYILNKVGAKPNIGETVLYKLLYFMDFDYYEKCEEQLIGATYRKNHYGPTPVEFRKIIDLMKKSGEIVQVNDDYFNYPRTKYLPKRAANLSVLGANEIEVINKVLERLSDMNATQISEYSHKDVPWLTTEEGAIIEYESVFYRTPEYSVRDYGDDIQAG